MKKVDKIADRADLGKVSFGCLELEAVDLDRTLRDIAGEFPFTTETFLGAVNGGLDLKQRALACARLELSPKKAREAVLAEICGLLEKGDTEGAIGLQGRFKAAKSDEALVALAKGLV